MNKAKLTGSSNDHLSYSLRLSVNKTFAVLAGGLVKGQWLDITADHVNIESSGVTSADGLGFGIRVGPGSSSGKKQLVVQDILSLYRYIHIYHLVKFVFSDF
jgi:hypothetical protein